MIEKIISGDKLIAIIIPLEFTKGRHRFEVLEEVEMIEVKQ